MPLLALARAVPRILCRSALGLNRRRKDTRSIRTYDILKTFAVREDVTVSAEAPGPVLPIRG